jgi:hypothetical protein
MLDAMIGRRGDGAKGRVHNVSGFRLDAGLGTERCEGEKMSPYVCNCALKKKA